MAHHGTLREVIHTVGSIGRALLAHQELNQELHDLAVEMRSLEAEFEYTPWRMPTVVEDLHKIWTLLGML